MSRWISPQRPGLWDAARLPAAPFRGAGHTPREQAVPPAPGQAEQRGGLVLQQGEPRLDSRYNLLIKWLNVLDWGRRQEQLQRPCLCVCVVGEGEWGTGGTERSRKS